MPRKAYRGDIGRDERAPLDVVSIDPPLPAPYLRSDAGAISDAPQLSPHLSYGSPLSIPDDELDRQPRLRLEMQKQVRDAARDIRRRRGDHEAAHGIVLISERPLGYVGPWP
jgi:hypothetical protein